MYVYEYSVSTVRTSVVRAQANETYSSISNSIILSVIYYNMW